MLVGWSERLTYLLGDQLILLPLVYAFYEPKRGGERFDKLLYY